MLHFGDDDASGLLEDGLIVPFGIQIGQLVGNSVVLSQPNGVHGGQESIIFSARIGGNVALFQSFVGWALRARSSRQLLFAAVGYVRKLEKTAFEQTHFSAGLGVVAVDVRQVKPVSEQVDLFSRSQVAVEVFDGRTRAHERYARLILVVVVLVRDGNVKAVRVFRVAVAAFRLAVVLCGRGDQTQIVSNTLTEPQQHVRPFRNALVWLVNNQRNAARVWQVLARQERSYSRHRDAIVVVLLEETFVRRLGHTPPWILQVVARTVERSVRVARITVDIVLLWAKRRRYFRRLVRVAQRHALLRRQELLVRRQCNRRRLGYSLRVATTTVPNAHLSFSTQNNHHHHYTISFGFKNNKKKKLSPYTSQGILRLSSAIPTI